MTKTSKLALSLLLGLLFWPGMASAFTAQAGDSVNLAKGEVIDGNLYLAGANLNIEGKVTGDVICAGQTINITGEVLGDVICAGQTINVGGRISGNLRALGSSVNLTGQVNKNATLGAASINTSASSSIGWEMLFGAAVAELKGAVGYDLTGAGNSVTLGGTIGKNVKLKIDNQRPGQPGVKILSGAVIGGKLAYTDRQDAQIDPGAKIAGEIMRSQSKIKEIGRAELFVGWLWGRLISLFSLLALGLIIVSLWPRSLDKVKEQLEKHYGQAIGWGFIAFFLTPVVIVMLIVSLVGLWLAALLAMAYLIALWVAEVFLALAFGRWLLDKVAPKQADKPFFTMFTGIIGAWLVFSIPVLGGLLSFLAILFGLGACFLAMKRT